MWLLLFPMNNISNFESFVINTISNLWEGEGKESSDARRNIHSSITMPNMAGRCKLNYLFLNPHREHLPPLLQFLTRYAAGTAENYIFDLIWLARWERTFWAGKLDAAFSGILFIYQEKKFISSYMDIFPLVLTTLLQHSTRNKFCFLNEGVIYTTSTLLTERKWTIAKANHIHGQCYH